VLILFFSLHILDDENLFARWCNTQAYSGIDWAAAIVAASSTYAHISASRPSHAALLGDNTYNINTKHILASQSARRLGIRANRLPACLRMEVQASASSTNLHIVTTRSPHVALLSQHLFNIITKHILAWLRGRRIARLANPFSGSIPYGHQHTRWIETAHVDIGFTPGRA
jgi:hypothetical protein